MILLVYPVILRRVSRAVDTIEHYFVNLSRFLVRVLPVLLFHSF
jgi:hypothetical protein